MAELPVKREDAIAFFRFQIISEMLDAQPGYHKASTIMAGQVSHTILPFLCSKIFYTKIACLFLSNQASPKVGFKKYILKRIRAMKMEHHSVS